MLECDMNDDGAVTCAEAIRAVYADHEYTGEARVRWDANAAKWTDAKMHVTHARRGSVEFLQEELSKARLRVADTLLPLGMQLLRDRRDWSPTEASAAVLAPYIFGKLGLHEEPPDPFGRDSS